MNQNNNTQGRIVRRIISLIILTFFVISFFPADSYAAVPTCGSVSVSNITGTSATLTCYITKNGGYSISSYGWQWSTNSKLNPCNSKWVQNSLEKNQNVYYTITGLSPNTTYYANFVANNADGAGYSEKIVSFKTAVVDTTQPLINPINSSAGTSFVYGTSTTFSTKASDNIELEEIILYIDNTVMKRAAFSAKEGTISYTTSSLSVGSHTVKVVAYDAAGNMNQTSNTITVTAADTTQPLINPINSSAGTSFVYGTSTTFSTKASDNIELEEIILYIDNTVMKRAAFSAKEGTISYTTSSLSVGSHTVKVVAYDAAGNMNQTSVTITVEESDTRPTTTFPAGNTEYYSLGEEYVSSGVVNGNGVNLTAVQISVFNSAGNGVAAWRWEGNAATVNLENKLSFTWGDTLNRHALSNSGDPMLDTATPGTYIIKVFATNSNGDGFKSDPILTAVVSDSGSNNDIYVEDLQVSPSSGGLGDRYTFTATAYNTDKVIFRIDNYIIGEATRKNDVFTCTYDSFTTAGTRTVYAYPCNSEGNIVCRNNNYACENFTIASNGKLDDVIISSDNMQKRIGINEDLHIEWAKPANAQNEGLSKVKYNLLVYKGGGEVFSVGEITNNYFDITSDDNVFTSEGSYSIGIAATDSAEGYEASNFSYCMISVEVAIPTIDDFQLSNDTVKKGQDITLSGIVNANGNCQLSKVTITVLKIADNTGDVFFTTELNNENKFDLNSVEAIDTDDKLLFGDIGDYQIRIFAKNKGSAKAYLLGSKDVQVKDNVITTLDKPQNITGANSIVKGMDYELSWDKVPNANYYIVEIPSHGVKIIVENSNKAVIKSGQFLRYGSGTGNYRFTIQACNTDSESYYSSEKAEFEVNIVSNDSGIIHKVEMSDYEFLAGEDIIFTITTSTDVDSVRMLDGDFMVGSWSSGYNDVGNERIWTIEQKCVSSIGKNRVLTFETGMNDGWTGNEYDVVFTCEENPNTIGAFNIEIPEAIDKNTDIVINWSVPECMPDSYSIYAEYNNMAIPNNKITTSSNSAVISGSVFTDYGICKIKITAKKSGYGESFAVASTTIKCTHQLKEKQEVTRYNYISLDNNTHQFTKTVKYLCQTCNAIVDETYNTSENHNFINTNTGGRYCPNCYYYETGNYSTWKGYTQSTDEDFNTYKDVNSSGTPTNKIGCVFKTDDGKITVLGVKGENYYLIKYPVKGGNKIGFISKKAIADRPYTPEKIDTTINPGNTEVKIDKSKPYQLSIDSGYISDNTVAITRYCSVFVRAINTDTGKTVLIGDTADLSLEYDANCFKYNGETLTAQNTEKAKTKISLKYKNEIIDSVDFRILKNYSYLSLLTEYSYGNSLAEHYCDTGYLPLYISEYSCTKNKNNCLVSFILNNQSPSTYTVKLYTGNGDFVDTIAIVTPQITSTGVVSAFVDASRGMTGLGQAIVTRNFDYVLNYSEKTKIKVKVPYGHELKIENAATDEEAMFWDIVTKSIFLIEMVSNQRMTSNNLDVIFSGINEKMIPKIYKAIIEDVNLKNIVLKDTLGAKNMYLKLSSCLKNNECGAEFLEIIKIVMCDYGIGLTVATGDEIIDGILSLTPAIFPKEILEKSTIAQDTLDIDRIRNDSKERRDKYSNWCPKIFIAPTHY